MSNGVIAESSFARFNLPVNFTRLLDDMRTESMSIDASVPRIIPKLRRCIIEFYTYDSKRLRRAQLASLTLALPRVPSDLRKQLCDNTSTPLPSDNANGTARKKRKTRRVGQGSGSDGLGERSSTSDEEDEEEWQSSDDSQGYKAAAAKLRNSDCRSMKADREEALASRASEREPSMAVTRRRLEEARAAFKAANDSVEAALSEQREVKGTIESFKAEVATLQATLVDAVSKQVRRYRDHHLARPL